MKKRLLCLLLVAVMLIACLASCGEKSDEEAIENVTEEASESAMTLCMYLLSENKISAEQEARIEEEVNKITKSKFKTMLDLKFYTADEYYAKLEESFAARAEAEAAGLIAAPVEGDETKEDETFENEWGFSEIKYPTIAGYQVDIFYVGGYDNFKKYLEMEMMQNLDTELSSASKKLNEYISVPYLKYMKSVNNGVYAVPTNTAIGEYTYLLFNKEALAKTRYDTTEGLKLLSGGIGDENLEIYFDDLKVRGYVPFYTNLSNTELAAIAQSQNPLEEEGDPNTYKGDGKVNYFGVTDNGQYTSTSFSLISGNYSASGKLGNKNSYMYNTIGNTWTGNTVFRNNLSTVLSYYSNGYVGTEKDFTDGKAAVLCLKGGADLPAQYAANYEAVAIGKPTIETADIYENMFAVSSYTANTGRSMEIITYLNTNEDFRNLLLYGVENENYELVDSDDYTYVEDGVEIPYKVVKRLNENYMMDTNKLGNTLIGYCLEGENPTLRASIMTQNNEAVASITMGFKFDYDDNVIDAEQLALLRDASRRVEELINNCKPTGDDGEVKATLDALSTQITAILGEADVKEMLISLASTVEPSSDGESVGLGYLYDQWAKATKIYVEPVVSEE